MPCRKILISPTQPFGKQTAPIEYIGAVAGVASVLGHIYPFWMKFKGGKGFASYLGMTIALNWKISIVVLLLVGIVTLVTDYIVAATTNT